MAATKSIILIGPGKHFGFELAKRFGLEGFHIVLVSRTADTLIKLSNKLNNENVACSYLALDANDKDLLSRELSELTKSIPPIAGLIFNLRAGTRGNGLEISPEDLTHALTTNVSGALVAVQAALPVLEKGASIIFTGGGYKDCPDSDKLALSVSKGALHTLFLSLIGPLKSRGIKIGTVVIDGAVRESGPIYPKDVAEAFWTVYQAKSGEVVEVG